MRFGKGVIYSTDDINVSHTYHNVFIVGFIDNRLYKLDNTIQ